MLGGFSEQLAMQHSMIIVTGLGATRGLIDKAANQQENEPGVHSFQHGVRPYLSEFTSLAVVAHGAGRCR